MHSDRELQAKVAQGVNVMRLLAICAVLVLTGCGTLSIDLYEGPQRGDKELAVVIPDQGCWRCVIAIKHDGEEAPIYTASLETFAVNDFPDKFRLLPGKYDFIIWHRVPGGGPVRAHGSVTLKPGHTYYVRYGTELYASKGRYLRSRRFAVGWMEDAASGEVLLGEKERK